MGRAHPLLGALSAFPTKEPPRWRSVPPTRALRLKFRRKRSIRPILAEDREFETSNSRMTKSGRTGSRR